MVTNRNKTHYASVERGNESQPYDEWSETACGLELEPDHLTNDKKWVTCKNCLRLMAPKTVTTN